MTKLTKVFLKNNFYFLRFVFAIFEAKQLTLFLGNPKYMQTIQTCPDTTSFYYRLKPQPLIKEVFS